MRRIEDEKRLLELLEPLLADLFDSRDGAAIRRSIDYDSFLRSPTALDEQFEAMMSRAMTRPDLVIKHRDALTQAVALSLSIQRSQRSSYRDHPAYRPTASALTEAVGRKGAQRAYASAQALFSLKPTKVVLPASLSVIAQPRPEMPFDEWAELMKREFVRLCETWLKGTFSALLMVVNDRVETPTQIGQLLSECETKWKGTPLSTIVNRAIVLIRNAIVVFPVCQDTVARGKWVC